MGRRLQQAIDAGKAQVGALLQHLPRTVSVSGSANRCPQGDSQPSEAWQGFDDVLSSGSSSNLAGLKGGSSGKVGEEAPNDKSQARSLLGLNSTTCETLEPCLSLPGQLGEANGIHPPAGTFSSVQGSSIHWESTGTVEKSFGAKDRIEDAERIFGAQDARDKDRFSGRSSFSLPEEGHQDPSLALFVGPHQGSQGSRIGSRSNEAEKDPCLRSESGDNDRELAGEGEDNFISEELQGCIAATQVDDHQLGPWQDFVQDDDDHDFAPTCSGTTSSSKRTWATPPEDLGRVDDDEFLQNEGGGAAQASGARGGGNNDGSSFWSVSESSASALHEDGLFGGNPAPAVTPTSGSEGALGFESVGSNADQRTQEASTQTAEAPRRPPRMPEMGSPVRSGAGPSQEQQNSRVQAAPTTHQFDGVWVAINHPGGISPWLSRLTIRGVSVIDGVGQPCHLQLQRQMQVQSQRVQERWLLAGGSLHRDEDMLFRVGRSGTALAFVRTSNT